MTTTIQYVNVYVSKLGYSGYFLDPGGFLWEVAHGASFDPKE